MSRRNKPPKRIIAADPIYNSQDVAKFTNRLMLRGKKSISERIVYACIENLKGKSDLAPEEMFLKVLHKARPFVKVKARRVGGSTYQVPIEVPEHEGIAIGTRWLIANARKRRGRSMVDKLTAEFLETFAGTSTTMKKRDETHRMAEANKAFAHYRF